MMGPWPNHMPPRFQADIVAQLGMEKPVHFIHGFRRENLAIEVVEVPVPERAGTISGLLADAARRPAIVYATSRKQAERLAEELRVRFRRRRTTRGWMRRRGSGCRRHSRRGSWRWWWRRSPSGWGSTRRIFGR